MHNFFFPPTSTQQMYKSKQRERERKRGALFFSFQPNPVKIKVNHFCILAKFRVEWLSCRTPCLVFEEVLSIFIATVWWFVFLRALRKFLSSSGLSAVSLFGFSGVLGFLNVIQTATEVHWLLPFLALAHSALPQIAPGYIKWSITSADLSLP